MRNRIAMFFNGNQRSVKAKKNIIALIAIKGISIVVGFLTVRVVLDYLDTSTYGIWLTLTSFLAWFSFFEIGLGSGLKNRLAVALAKEDYHLAKIYVSTTYAILAIIITTVSLFFFIANIFIDWAKILNADNVSSNDLTNVAFIVFSFFFLSFVLKLIGTVLMSDQRNAISQSFGPIGNVISLILIFIFTKTTESSLVILATILSIVPIVVFMIASLYFYRTDYRRIAPSFRFVDFRYAKDLFSLGIKFFVIQIQLIIIYQSSNFIIAHYFGPSDVTTYNIAHKYFSIIMMAFTIIISPFWTAYTEAWVKNDIIWIKSTISKLFRIWILMSIMGIFMLIFSDKFYYLWIGDKVKIPFELSLILLVYFVTLTFGGVFNMFINGVGKIQIQMYSSIFAVIIFLIGAYVFIENFNFGIKGLVISMILSNFYGIVLAPIQYNKLINKKATGLWNK